jgi:hypothetical protein
MIRVSDPHESAVRRQGVGSPWADPGALCHRSSHGQPMFSNMMQMIPRRSIIASSMSRQREVGSAMEPGDRKWALGRISLVVAVLAAFLTLLLGPWGKTTHLSAGDLTAIVGFAGLFITATVSLIGMTVTRQANRRLSQEREQVDRRLAQEHRDEESRLRLDAAMRAGALFSSSDSAPVASASIASSLLALTKLNNADLAVALLVDFWTDAQEKVSNEAAILVIDAALRSKTQPNAQLVAAEILCRRSPHLDSCQSLNWPSVIDGCWDRDFGPKTKFLLVEALINMALARAANENSLRSVAVRLYGIWRGDSDLRLQGCVGKLISALTPKLERLGYTDFIQGNQKVMLGDLQQAAASATDNPDGFLDRIVEDRYEKLIEWASHCTSDSLELGTGALATVALA